MIGVAATVLLLAGAAERDTDALGALIPDYARLGSGGYAGLVVVGLGYAAWDDRVNVGLSYGYVPASLAGTTVHASSATLTLRPFELTAARLRWVPLYAGIGALCTFGPRYFFRLPERYPDGYYRPTALHPTAHVGSEWDLVAGAPPFERHGVFAELVTLEVFLRRYLRNPQGVALTEVVALGVGYRVAF